MNITHCPRLILIAGTGQNSGKTTLACQIIQHLITSHDVVAVKISPHPHKGNEQILTNRHLPYGIWEETSPTEGKDTFRMHQAGAKKVFYIEADNDHLSEAFQMVINQIPENSIIICESGGLRDIIQPGVFIMATNPDKTPKPSSLKFMLLADLILPLQHILHNNYICPVVIHEGLPKINPTLQYTKSNGNTLTSGIITG